MEQVELRRDGVGLRRVFLGLLDALGVLEADFAREFFQGSVGRDLFVFFPSCADDLVLDISDDLSRGF